MNNMKLPDNLYEDDLLSSEEIRMFSSSLDRSIANEEFLDHFYHQLIESDPAMLQIFHNVNLQALKAKLAKTLAIMTLANVEPWRVNDHLYELGKHHQSLSIDRVLFGNWRDALIDTLRHCDPEFNDEVQGVWMKASKVAVYKMLTGYNQQAAIAST